MYTIAAVVEDLGIQFLYQIKLHLALNLCTRNRGITANISDAFQDQRSWRSKAEQKQVITCRVRGRDSICSLTLTLFMLLVGLAVDVDSALSSNDVAVIAELLDGCSDLEASGECRLDDGEGGAEGLLCEKRGRLWTCHE